MLISAERKPILLEAERSRNYLTPLKNTFLAYFKKANADLGGTQRLKDPLDTLYIKKMCSLGEPNLANVIEDDVLTALSFDCTGRYLSVGDKQGRVIIFEKHVDPYGSVTFEYLSEFKDKVKRYVSNTPDKDNITQIQWLNRFMKKPLVMTAKNSAGV